MSIKRVIETFHILDNWDDRYDFIIDLGKKLPGIPADEQCDHNKVMGCMSNVWITAETNPEQADNILLHADSDAPIVRGLVTILVLLYNDKPLKEIEETDIDALFEQLSLAEHLSPNRHVGMYAMVEKIKQQSRCCTE
jgi:cysteine desulfuration protein SufE